MVIVIQQAGWWLILMSSVLEKYRNRAGRTSEFIAHHYDFSISQSLL